MSKKIAIAAGALLGFLLVFVIAVPFLFRDRITERADTALEEAVAARVEWQGVGLSLLRSFPHLSFRMDDLTVTGIDGFEGDTLASIPRLRLVLDLASLWGNVRRGEPIVVRSVDLERPALHLRVLEDGTANWDILTEHAEEPRPEEARGIDVSLRRFAVRDGTITLDDRESGLSASLAGFNQTLRGDFTKDFLLVRTLARADEASVRFGGIPYLNRVRLDLTADVEADMIERRFTFRENELRLNDLALGFSGSAVAGDDVMLDLTFDAPATDFRHLLSLMPAIYRHDFESLQTAGRMTVSGRVQGRYGDEALPSFALNATVEDGSFRYPDLPLPARDIALDLSIENPGGDLDRTVVELKRFHLIIGNDPIEGALALRTPVSDPDVELRLLGRLDLADLKRTVKLDQVEELTGVVSADATLRTRMSFVDARQYDRIAARGGAEARNVTVRAEGIPDPVLIEEAALRLSPEHAELTSFRGRVGESDLLLTGYLDNLLGYALRDDSLRGRATLESGRFDLNEWRSDAEDHDVIPVPANVDFALEVNIAQLSYGMLEMTGARGVVHLENGRATLHDFRTNMLGGEIVVGGFYDTADIDRPAFDVDMRLVGLDIPAAFAELATVRALAPVAGYARGRVSADLELRGALGPDMAPLFTTLAGHGSLETSQLLLEEFPGLSRAADALMLDQLRNPMLDPVRASFDIRDGRLHLSPMEARLGDLRMTVAGSNGVDQSLQYTLRLQAPRAVLGSAAEGAIAGLLVRAGRAGIELEAADAIELAIQLTGTVTDPSISTDVGDLLTFAREGLERSVREEAGHRLEELEQRAGEAEAAARAEADRIRRAAEERAAAVREEAQKLAENVKREGYARADSLLERATDPVARAAARVAADRLRREADEQAQRIIREADEQAQRIVRDAELRADEIPPEGGR